MPLSSSVGPGVGGSELAAASPPGAATRDLRSGLEGAVRAAWRDRADPLTTALLRGASGLYGAAVDARNFAYEAGVLRPRAAPLPVVSVGGLTVGGAGKTPLAAALAAWLHREDRAPAVLTHGFEDEMGVHRSLNPGVPVFGGRDRLAGAVRAAREGCRTAVLDDGFQHRRLARDLEVLAVRVGSLQGARRRLPAGPFRERLSEIGRADAVVLTRRHGSAGRAAQLAEWLRRRAGVGQVGRCALRPGRLLAGNDAARGSGEARPAVALASVMHPEVALEQLADGRATVQRTYVLPDHGLPSSSVLEEIARVAGAGGVAGTLKDVVKLRGRLPGSVPLWYLEDRMAWEEGGPALRELLLTRTARRPPPDARRAGGGEAGSDAGDDAAGDGRTNPSTPTSTIS